MSPGCIVIQEKVSAMAECWPLRRETLLIVYPIAVRGWIHLSFISLRELPSWFCPWLHTMHGAKNFREGVLLFRSMEYSASSAYGPSMLHIAVQYQLLITRYSSDQKWFLTITKKDADFVFSLPYCKLEWYLLIEFGDESKHIHQSFDCFSAYWEHFRYFFDCWMRKICHGCVQMLVIKLPMGAQNEIDL